MTSRLILTALTNSKNRDRPQDTNDFRGADNETKGASGSSLSSCFLSGLRRRSPDLRLRPRGLGIESAPSLPTGRTIGGPVPYVVGILIGLVAGAVGAWAIVSFSTDSKLAAARRTRSLLLEEARREADALRRESELAAKEEAARVRGQTERDLDERRSEMLEREQRSRLAEEELARQREELERRESRARRP